MSRHTNYQIREAVINLSVRVDEIIKHKATKDVKKTASEIVQELRDEILANVYLFWFQT